MGNSVNRRRCSSDSGNESRPVERYERPPLSRGSVLSTKRYSSLASSVERTAGGYPDLSKIFYSAFCHRDEENITEITADAEAKLVCYGWPGNVRELANVIERVVTLSEGPEIAGEDLPPRIADTETDGAADGFSYRRAVDSARADVIKKSPCTHPRKSRRRGEKPGAAQNSSPESNENAWYRVKMSVDCGVTTTGENRLLPALMLQDCLDAPYGPHFR